MVAMLDLEKLRAEAAALEQEARAAGHPIKHTFALEQIAQKHGFANWRACLATLRRQTAQETESSGFQRFHNAHWNYSLDMPTGWFEFPAVSTNSPYETARFISREDGLNVLIVFRIPHIPKNTPEEISRGAQVHLEKAGFSNFQIGAAMMGRRSVLTMDFDGTLNEKPWLCRHYFWIDGSPVRYTLGFGSTDRDAVSTIMDRVALSFSSEEPKLGPSQA